MHSGPARRRWTRRRVVLVAVGAVLAVLVAAVGAVAVLVDRLEGNVERDDVFAQIAEDDRPEQERLGALDILVLGSDSRDEVGAEFQGEGDEAVEGERADTTVLAHLNAGRDAAWLVSIPRDSWVELPPCRGRDGSRLPAREGQFNSAFLDGGLTCTVRAVESLTGVRVDHTAVVDFRGFQDMVDALGGVPVCLAEPFTPTRVDLRLPAGRSMLDGRQALEFVRARYGVGDGTDLSRIERQKQVMASMLDRALSRDLLLRPDRLVGFLSAATKHLRVDEGLDLRELALSLRGIDPHRVTLSTVPLDATPGPAFQEGGPLYGRVAWDEQAAAALFGDLRADRLPTQAAAPGAPPSGTAAPAPGGSAAPGTTGAPDAPPPAATATSGAPAPGPTAAANQTTAAAAACS